MLLDDPPEEWDPPELPEEEPPELWFSDTDSVFAGSDPPSDPSSAKAAVGMNASTIAMVRMIAIIFSFIVFFLVFMVFSPYFLLRIGYFTVSGLSYPALCYIRGGYLSKWLTFFKIY